jgi:hypothetical protein
VKLLKSGAIQIGWRTLKTRQKAVTNAHAHNHASVGRDGEVASA